MSDQLEISIDATTFAVTIKIPSCPGGRQIAYFCNLDDLGNMLATPDEGVIGELKNFITPDEHRMYVETLRGYLAEAKAERDKQRKAT